MIKNIILILLIFSFGISCDKPMPGSAKKKKGNLKTKNSKESILKSLEEGNAKAIEVQKLFIQTNENLKQLKKFKESTKESDKERLIILFSVPEDLFKILMNLREAAKESVKISSQLLKLTTKAQSIKKCIAQSKLALKQSQSLFLKAQQAEKLLAIFLRTFQKTYGYIDTVQLFPAESDSQENTLNLSFAQQDPGPDSNSSFVQDNKILSSNKDILYELTTSSLSIKNVMKAGLLLMKPLDALLTYAQEASELPLIKIINKKTIKPAVPKDKEEKEFIASNKVQDKEEKEFIASNKVQDKEEKEFIASNKVQDKEEKEFIASNKVQDKEEKEFIASNKVQDKETTIIPDAQVKKKKLAELAASQIEVEDSLELSDPQENIQNL